MTRMQLSLLTITLAAVSTAYGQSSSLMWLPPNNPSNANGQDNTRLTRVQPGYARTSTQDDPNSSFNAIPPKDASRPGTRAIEMTSLIAVPPVPARKFKTNDLVNIIVRQQKKYQADGKANTKNEWNIDGKLSEWLHLYDSHVLGSAELRAGQPSYKFTSKNESKKDADSEREDKFTTYLQATVIDVKPNGNLVLEAKMEEQHDEEHFTITLTGMCRSEDVTPTNSVLSTQIANIVLMESNKGSVRDATKRGFIPRILDFTKAY